MDVSSELISQFAKVVKEDKTNTKNESTVYGTIRIINGKSYVQIDGSSQNTPTPVSSTTDVVDGDRVTVMIKNHTATVTGNTSKPSASSTSVNAQINNLSNKVDEFENIIADTVTTEQFQAEVARIDNVLSDVVTTEKLEAFEADITNLQAEDVTIKNQLSAQNASINNLETTKLDAAVADVTYATISDLEATNADIDILEADHATFKTATADKFEAVDASIAELEAGKITTEQLDAKYANIDFSNIGKAAMEYFYSTSGLIENVVVGDQTITGNLVGVTISGDLIKGNTVKAEKLIIKGSDGLYYKLNTDGMKTEAEQTDSNSLNGSIIKAKSITASKITVDDLVAFDATIGGFNITDSSLYSGVKSAVDNTTRGVYLDKDGQAAIGDSDNFIKYYKDADGKYKLTISADSIIFSSSNKSIEEAVADNIEIGGRNLFRNSKTCSGWVHNDTVTFEPADTDGFTIINFGDVETASYNRVTPIPNVPYSVVRNKTITISLYVRADENKMESSYANSILCSVGIAPSATSNRTLYKDYWLKDENDYYALTTEWQKRSITLDIEDSIFSSGTGEITDDSYFVVNFYRYNLAGAQLKALKLELGNKATDWSPAPEDLATADDVTRANNAADSAQQTANDAETLIKQLSDNISTLVTDGNGTSLMTQTESGWVFSTSEIQKAVNATSEGLDTLTNTLGSTNNAVEVLQQAVKDLGTLAEYIKIGTYEGEPCIELGEGDSEFKLRITNTRIMFMEGSGIPAYFTNQSMHIKKAVIEEELQQGGFVWKARSNGNLGLVWKGATN